jgi:hypothetical protein
MTPTDISLLANPEYLTHLIEQVTDALYWAIVGVAGLIVFIYLALAVYRAMNHPRP